MPHRRGAEYPDPGILSSVLLRFFQGLRKFE
jgi:hypothetical protein